MVNAPKRTICAPKSADRKARRKQDLLEKKYHIPKPDRSNSEQPPVIVGVVGPPQVGKTTLIKSLVKYYTRHSLNTTTGPITLVSGKKRRITLIECNNDLHSMVDLAKVADLILLMVDASFGFEMELFEFLNICQSHGFPKIMAILTHLDEIKSEAEKKKVKKTMKKRFWAEIYKGAKLFFASGVFHGIYGKRDTQNIARYVSVMKYRPLTWQTNHPYMVIDRMEDLTNPESIRQNPLIDRRVSMYGFVRGLPFLPNSAIHIPGCGDFKLSTIANVPDPCPLPKRTDKTRNSLNQKERMIYAPFCGVGGVLCDKDAIYIEISGAHSFSERIATHEADQIVNNMLRSSGTMDVIKSSEPKIFSNQDQEDIPNEDSEVVQDLIYDDDLDTCDDSQLIKDIVIPQADNSIDCTIKEYCIKENLEVDVEDNIEEDNEDDIEEHVYDENEEDVDDDLEGDIEEDYEENIEDDIDEDIDQDIEKDKELRQKKLQKKSQFDAQYDKEETTYYDEQKEKFKLQADTNNQFLDGLDEHERLEVEGFRPGLYVRVELEMVPSGLVNHFDPSHPLIIGGLNPGELGDGYVTVKLKKHRWYKKILKTRDPLIISLGWRRFQTIPIYHIMDDNSRNRALKYTPWHLHCLATFWGPLAPQGTGLIAFQQTDGFTTDFRIACTGVILDLNKTIDIVKKLKLVGTPMKVFTKTAFVKGMFGSALEVSKFEGAPIRTVSGIRGLIKKSISEAPGAFRATFEDKILMSDIIFLRTWYNVNVPKIYILVKTLLMTTEERSKWRGARTIGRIRFEEGLKSKTSTNPDSIYKPVDRKQFNFRPFTIPTKLQNELPYKIRPKFQPEHKDDIERHNAISSDHEKKRIKTLIKMNHLRRAKVNNKR